MPSFFRRFLALFSCTRKQATCDNDDSETSPPTSPITFRHNVSIDFSPSPEPSEPIMTIEPHPSSLSTIIEGEEPPEEKQSPCMRKLLSDIRAVLNKPKLDDYSKSLDETKTEIVCVQLRKLNATLSSQGEAVVPKTETEHLLPQQDERTSDANVPETESGKSKYDKTLFHYPIEYQLSSFTDSSLGLEVEETDTESPKSVLNQLIDQRRFSVTDADSSELQFDLEIDATVTDRSQCSLNVGNFAERKLIVANELSYRRMRKRLMRLKRLKIRRLQFLSVRPYLNNQDLLDGFNKDYWRKEFIVRLLDSDELDKGLFIGHSLMAMVEGIKIGLADNGQMRCAVRGEKEEGIAKLKKWRSSESLHYAGYKSETDVFKTPMMFDTTAEDAENSEKEAASGNKSN